MSLSDRWQRELDELRALKRDRHFQPPHVYHFSSNDYLGYGARLFSDTSPLPRGATASRLLRGHHPAWDAVEERLARWHGAGSGLVVQNDSGRQETPRV